jgi:hypothetical protein
MLYQTIKHLKTKSKVIALSKTMGEAVAAIPLPASFVELTYMGGFPIFNSGKGVYSIQGQHEALGIVCSLSEADTAPYRHD